MVTPLESSRKFRDKILNSFNRSKNDVWTKAEVQSKIKDLWTELLEEEILKRREGE